MASFSMTLCDLAKYYMTRSESWDSCQSL